MTASVVVILDEISDLQGPDDLAFNIVGAIHFTFERGEETFGDRVVPTVALAAHAAVDVTCLQGFAVSARNVGAPAV